MITADTEDNDRLNLKEKVIQGSIIIEGIKYIGEIGNLCMKKVSY